MSAPGGWLARLPAREAEALVALRLLDGIEVCLTESWAWVRGSRWDEDVAHQLRRIPGLSRCHGQPGGPATIIGQQLPSGQVPDNG